MAKFNDNLKVSNEEIEAKVEEFTQKIETLRVRYEQYFVGTEKKAPIQLRMDVARLMRDLEHANIRNTALKFNVNTCIQKFTSYSTYWNRVLREIEDGTYKRHLDRAKRMISADAKPTNTQTLKQQAESTPRTKATQEIADEAEAFLASLGLASTPRSEPTDTRTAPGPNIVRPAFIKTGDSATHSPASQKDTQPNPAIRHHAATQKATQPNPAIQQTAANPAVQRPQHAPTINPSAANPAVQRPQRAPTINPSAANPAVQRPQHAPTINPSAANPAVQRTQLPPAGNQPTGQSTQRATAGRPLPPLPRPPHQR